MKIVSQLIFLTSLYVSTNLLVLSGSRSSLPVNSSTAHTSAWTASTHSSWCSSHQMLTAAARKMMTPANKFQPVTRAPHRTPTRPMQERAGFNKAFVPDVSPKDLLGRDDGRHQQPQAQLPHVDVDAFLLHRSCCRAHGSDGSITSPNYFFF